MDSTYIKEGLKYLSSLKGWVGQKDFSLARIQAVAKYFRNPQDQFKSIHVAGTNGKGSTSSTLSAILVEAGYKVGLYTSPHLVSINERIKINEKDISDECLVKYSDKVKEATYTLKIELSQFEVLTLISFLVFQDQAVDYAVVEVGLGGRLDATNIISKPDIAVITSISTDHQDVLGDSIFEIAREKAGILKIGTTLLLGELPQGVRESISGNYARCSQVIEFNKDFYGRSTLTNIGERLQNIEYNDDTKEISLKTTLLGKHQVSNVCVAVKAALLLGVLPEVVKQGVAKASWEARLEFLHVASKTILLDAAHNEAGVRAANTFCKENDFIPEVVVFAALKTKNWKEMLLSIDMKIKQWFIVESDSDMTLEAEEIEKFISMHDLGMTKCFAKDYTRLANEIINLPQNTNVLALGSIYMLAALKPQLDAIRT